MKNIFKTIITVGIILGSISFANAVYINDNGDYEADADKFIPQKRVNMKNSVLADKLENNMQRARGNNVQTEQRQYNNTNKENSSNPNYRKTYKWF